MKVGASGGGSGDVSESSGTVLAQRKGRFGEVAAILKNFLLLLFFLADYELNMDGKDVVFFIFFEQAVVELHYQTAVGLSLS